MTKENIVKLPGTKQFEFGGLNLQLRLDGKSIIAIEKRLDESLMGLFVNGQGGFKLPATNKLLVVLQGANQTSRVSDSDLVNAFERFVEAGISSTDFWAMTFDEIMVQVEANKKRHENELKEKAMFDYTQQRLGIYAFNDPKNFPKYEDAYPFLNQLKEEVEQAVSEEEEKKQAMFSDQEIMRQNAMLIQETRKRKSQKTN